MTTLTSSPAPSTDLRAVFLGAVLDQLSVMTFDSDWTHAERMALPVSNAIALVVAPLAPEFAAVMGALFEGGWAGTSAELFDAAAAVVAPVVVDEAADA